jgi:hypothetical protein
VDHTFPETIIHDKDNTNALLKLSRYNNTIQLGLLDFTTATDSIKVGGNALSLYSKFNFSFISPNYGVALTLISNALKFENKNNYSL